MCASASVCVKLEFLIKSSGLGVRVLIVTWKFTDQSDTRSVHRTIEPCPLVAADTKHPLPLESLGISAKVRVDSFDLGKAETSSPVAMVFHDKSSKGQTRADSLSDRLLARSLGPSKGQSYCARLNIHQFRSTRDPLYRR